MPGYSRISDAIFSGGGGGALFQKYHCPSCKYLLRDAVQPSCGHWLCQSCAEELFQNADGSPPRCPKEDCREELTGEDGMNYFPDRFVRKEILNFKVVCLNHDQGCGWKGKFADYENHLGQCEYDLHTCEHCGQTFPGQELDAHLATCSKLPKLCPLAEFGCPEKQTMPRDALYIHFHSDDSTVLHWEIVAKVLKAMRVRRVELPPRPQAEGCSKDHQEVPFAERYPDIVETDGPNQPKSDELDGTNPERTKAATEFQTVVSQHEMMFPTQQNAELVQRMMKSSIQEAMGKLRGELENVMQGELKKKEEDITSLQATVTKLEKMLRAKNAEIEDRDFRLSLIENSNYDGSMVWKIPQFSQRMADAQSGKYTSIFSLPFYTGRYGYKMCLRLYILGDGIGKNTHMSLFFVIMRGEFDNILPWSFTYRVTFRLMNQTPGGRDIIDTFQPDPMSSSFKKPKNDMNIASGCPRLVSHLELKNGGFIVEDTVFIKCSVDTSTIKHP